MAKITNDLRIRVNRAPVLTLWAAVVAERLGHSPEAALSLASYVAGTAARTRIPLQGPAKGAAHMESTVSSASKSSTRLLGREVPLTEGADGMVLADAGGGNPAPAAPIEAYLARAFGQHLPKVRAAMEELAAPYAPAELNRVGLELYEHFRPELPPRGVTMGCA